MAIRKPIILEVAHNTYMIDLFGMQTPSLLVGGERALLLDTGFGNWDLKGLVRGITDKPLVVVISHAHGDHIGGMGQFAELHVHPADRPAVEEFALRGMSAEMIGGEIGRIRQDPDCVFDIPPEPLPAEHTSHVYKDLAPHQIIDLGGRPVEVLCARGHTAGQIVLLDYKERILFSGDGCNTNLGIRALPIETALRDLLVIKERQGLFDRNFTGHLGWHGYMDNLSADTHATLDACIFIMRGILDGSVVGEPAHSPYPAKEGGPPTPARLSAQHGGVRITYDPERIFDER